jgi:inosine-uridine nucleoside N-ribohydrolase
VKIWIDTDVGDDPDDAIALWCAARAYDAEVVGVSTVDGDVEWRATRARELLPGVPVVAGPPDPAQLAGVDALLGIGPWTHVAQLADEHALPLRVVLMGGALGIVRHHGEPLRVEHNVGRDPAAARRLLANTGNLIVVPLDATAPIAATDDDEKLLVEHIPGLDRDLDRWRTARGPRRLVLHDPASLLVALGERVTRMESRRLKVEPNGEMYASVDGPLQHVVAYVNADATRSRVRTLALRG